VLKLGFLDGRRGFLLALMEARYAYLKYRKLMALRERAHSDSVTEDVPEARLSSVPLDGSRV
jgi:hypothetical protein